MGILSWYLPEATIMIHRTPMIEGAGACREKAKEGVTDLSVQAQGIGPKKVPGFVSRPLSTRRKILVTLRVFQKPKKSGVSDFLHLSSTNTFLLLACDEGASDRAQVRCWSRDAAARSIPAEEAIAP